jgi:hypothetical protein
MSFRADSLLTRKISRCFSPAYGGEKQNRFPTFCELDITLCCCKMHDFLRSYKKAFNAKKKEVLVAIFKLMYRENYKDNNRNI